jgi:phosphatidate phosphatase PAH1
LELKEEAMGAIRFCKVPKDRENEIFEREKVTRIQGMYLGESGTLYFVQEDFENSIENDKKICYNSNINKKVSFIEPI